MSVTLVSRLILNLHRTANRQPIGTDLGGHTTQWSRISFGVPSTTMGEIAADIDDDDDLDTYVENVVEEEVYPCPIP